MASDALRLLFELDVDSRAGTAGLLRFRKDIAATIEATRRAITQPLKAPNTAPIVAAAKTSASAQEREQRRLNAAVQSLQRQRSAALFRAFKSEERAAIASAKAQERAVAASFKAQEKAAIASARAQERAAQQAAKTATQGFSLQKLTAQRERENQQLQRAAESLQRQRSAGIIRQLREQEKTAERTAKAFRDRFLAIGGIFENLGQSISSFGSRLSIAVTAPLAALAAVSVKSAVGLDAQVNTLKAFTGSAEAAEQRLAKLIATAQQTPGLTTSLSLMLDSQLRLANVTVETIDKVTPAIGRLNAVQKLQDPARFSQNLVQLVTQNFERIDLKELVGQSPVAGQIIKEMFNVDSPINAEAIRESAKRMGLTTTDAFFTAFAEAAARNSALSSVTESIATRFDKLTDRVTIALRPLGVAIIDSIVPFVNLLVPILESLGRGFADLPGPVKTLAVALGTVVASAGPVTFLLGSMISTVGSLVGAYARLVALGLTPTIKGFQLLVQVMRGTAALTAGQAATTAAAAAGWAALAGVVVVAVAAIAGAYLLFSGSQKEAVKVSTAQLEVMDRQINGLKQQARFLDGLKVGVQRTAQEQKRLSEIYGELNIKAQTRVEGISDEEKRLRTLREELANLIKLREAERVQQAANLAGSLGDTLQQIDANEKEIRSITARIQANTELAETIQRTNTLTVEQSRQLARQGINASNATEAVAGLQSESENLVTSQKDLRDATEKLNGTAQEQAATLQILQKQTGLSARELLTAAKSMGVFRGDVESALSVLERFTASQTSAADATRSLTDAITEQTAALLEAGKQVNELQKQRKATIEAAADLAREASDSLAGADKFLRSFIAAQPELRAAIEKERQLQGKTLEEFVTDTIGGRPKRSARGEDQETQRRIRLLELEAARTEAINRQNIEAERLRFELRDKSLKQATDDEIKLEQEILDKKRKVFAAELVEAQKLKKGRELAVKEINLKSLQAEIDFHNKANQLRVNQRKVEEQAAIQHRQKLLDIQDEGDRREIARLEELTRTGAVTAFDLESRRAEIEDNARRRRRAELESELKETKENKEERQRIQDELDQFNAQSATATEEAERRKRAALQETADAYRDYVIAIREASEAAAEATRNAAAVALSRLNARVFLTEQQRIQRRFAIDKSLLEAEKRASDLRIDNAEREAIEKSKRAGKLEQEALTIEKTFNALRLAEQKRFEQEKRKLEEDKNADLERANPSSTRSLFGETFADNIRALKNAFGEFSNTVDKLILTFRALAKTALEFFKQGAKEAGNFGDIAGRAFDNVAQALGSVLEQYILTGETGPAVLRKILAATLATIAKESLVKAIYETAAGFAALFLNPAEAVAHFKSAALYGAAAAAAGFAGRAIAGDLFKQKDTAGRAVNGGEPSPRNQSFSYGGQGPVESSSRAAQEGSGGLLSRREANDRALVDALNNHTAATVQLNATISRLKTQPKGVVVADGLNENPAAAGNAVLVHSNASGDFNETLQRNLGFGR